MRSITQVRSRNWCCVLETDCIYTLNHILTLSYFLSYNSVEILLVSWWYSWYTDILTNYWFCYLSNSTFSTYRLLICILRQSIRFINAVFCHFWLWNERYLNICCFHHIRNNSGVSRLILLSSNFNFLIIPTSDMYSKTVNTIYQCSFLSFLALKRKISRDISIFFVFTILIIIVASAGRQYSPWQSPYKKSF